MKLTAELVARVERKEPDPGPEPGTAEHTDAEFDAIVGELLSQYKGDYALDNTKAVEFLKATN